ncbi:crossover junction endonuclease MUS81 isoform X2 [Scleropages formosus]|uniref:Crossover junction endonuclease MUS81 n=1 Tax=Scleropages formosus TaxID=113540 RepID=A0A8C9RK65_SCLFO|nr:crossover junction endonuclease MUS81 isoform X2 [Scleropages formosus]
MASSEPPRLGRKRPLPPCPNPLFVRWLSELRDQAAERGLKTQYVYQKALRSLKKYPLPLKNGREAKILQNFGDGICKFLDDRLQKYYREHGVDAPIHSLPDGGVPSHREVRNQDPSNLPSEPDKESPGEGAVEMQQRDRRKQIGGRKGRQYVPQKRSGGYAVLLTLYRHCQVPGNKGFMFKTELQREAQHLCDTSFTVPNMGSKYTAWSSVSTLIQKDLLLKTHSPARYSLTELGLALAERLEASESTGNEELKTGRTWVEGKEDARVMVDLTEEESEEENSTTERPTPPVSTAQEKLVEPGTSILGKVQAAGSEVQVAAGSLLPGCYDVILCVDFIETTGGNTARKQELVKELQRNGVPFDIRKLNVGDFLWVAREKVTPVPGQLRPPPARELVLDYIIERKRIDDLCGSITDGRFREQKFRLKRCGLRHPIYLVEECGSAGAHLSLPESTLQQAIVNTQVVDGFFVKRVQDVKESAAYLTVMTRYLQKLYQNKTLVCRSKEDLEGQGGNERVCAVKERENPSCSLLSFAEFNQGAVKNKCQTVREVFARQLMQISGVSGDKATAILEHYGTVSSLIEAYQQCPSDTDREKLLSCVRYGKLKRNLGPALSRTIYQLYWTQGPLS